MTYIASEAELREAVAYIADRILEKNPITGATLNDSMLIDGIHAHLEEQYRQAAAAAVNAAFYGTAETGEDTDE